MNNLGERYGHDHYFPVIDAPMVEANDFVIPSRIKRAINTTFCGIEIEVEKTHFDGLFNTKYWSLTDDGSLRDRGAEFVSLKGMVVGHLQAAMSDINEYVNSVRKVQKLDNLFTFSERCSVHVHLDIRNFTDEMVEALLILYTLYEDQLFRLCDPLRSCNVFCIPLRASAISINSFGESNIWRIVDKFSKYSAINLEAAKKYGTVEFRHHEGTFNFGTINQWVHILGLIRYFAERVKIKSFRERISRMKTESAYEALTAEVFYGLAPQIMSITNPMEMDLAVSDAKLFFMGDV